MMIRAQADLTRGTPGDDAGIAMLAGRIAAMGGQAERMVDQAVAALVNADAGLARRVVEEDRLLDEGQRRVDEDAMDLIERRRPGGAELREIIGAIRIAAELERVGDLGKNIAKRVGAVSEDGQPVRLLRGLEALAGLALTQLKQVLDIYASRSLASIAFVRDRDDAIDAHYTSLFGELLGRMGEDPRSISTSTHLLFCAKNIERIGDHATNIAEAVHHIVTGTYMPLERPKDDRSHHVVLPSFEH